MKHVLYYWLYYQLSTLHVLHVRANTLKHNANAFAHRQYYYDVPTATLQVTYGQFRMWPPCVNRITRRMFVAKVCITNPNNNTVDTLLCMNLLMLWMYLHKFKTNLPCWWKSLVTRMGCVDGQMRWNLLAISDQQLHPVVARFFAGIIEEYFL